MRIIPSEISSRTRSKAERDVFAALQAIPDDQSVALHTVHLPKHHRKRVGEIDFVVITPDILLFIEVKGGRIVQHDGKWYYGPPGREDRKEESPWEQASGGMHEFEREMSVLVGNLRRQGVLGGYLVITPDVDIPRMTHFEPEQYLGSTAWNGGRGLAGGIERATAHWRSENKWAGPISPALRRKMLDAIRPDFDRVPNLRSRLTDLDATFERLTAEQMEKLDEVESNKRLILTGGAGTGKTFLAAEAARRRAAHGSVLFTCVGTTLATHMTRVLADDATTVLPYHRLDEVKGRVFDQLIVDEAQDLMNVDSLLGTLDPLLSGGLSEGRWLFMLDQNNQVLNLDAYDPDTWKWLSDLGCVVGPLRRNCRNTHQIVDQVRSYTGADLGVASAGEGEKVRFPAVQDVRDEAAALDAYIDGLVAEGVSPEEITLLSVSGDWETSSARLSGRASRIQRFTDVVGTDNRKRRPLWSSVSDFKGHENHIVCLIDLEPAHLEGRLDAIYVAWTRARSQLWIACRPGTRELLKQLGIAVLRREAQTA
ncbi:NERD domain-containing protein [Streptomyces sp. NPDC006784]|uniref:nuclease-related domain-containing DEAD/DEAH box helicase n=1 Tax=Streptomyces sp. NPDC006784 TaxID=3364764 RepID=UPI0036978CDB